MPLILLTSFITALAVLAAWPVKFKPKLFFFLILVMDGGQIAVFAVQDMLLFFLTWELNSRLFITGYMGWQKSTICSNKIHYLYSWQFYLHSSCSFSNGFLWYRNS
jgi:NADH:ubiquinone oxidoreductase subunit 4 (subunit M)